jgi:hypothetical protein
MNRDIRDIQSSILNALCSETSSRIIISANLRSLGITDQDLDLAWKDLQDSDGPTPFVANRIRFHAEDLPGAIGTRRCPPRLRRISSDLRRLRHPHLDADPSLVWFRNLVKSVASKI